MMLFTRNAGGRACRGLAGLRRFFLPRPFGCQPLGQRNDPRWQIVYEDREAILLVRADEAHAEVLRRFRAGELRKPDTARPDYFE